MNIYDELQWRGLIADCTDREQLTGRLAAGPLALYCGFDPSADSLHVGNLVPLMALRRFQLAGHHSIALAGGATGSIGDPSGRTQERQLLTPEILHHNISKIKEQLARLLDFESASNPARLLDNASWSADMRYIDFLRDIGKHFSVNQMIAKESVRTRMEDRESGITYTEFSYMLLQAFDFYVLRRDYNCELQIGASDQWGNITAGTDLCRKRLGASVYGLTLPLMTKADGTKYGKTATGTVWLDPAKTSPYRFYQFFIQLDDRDLIKILKMLSLADREAIGDLERQHIENPGARAAHQALAHELTTLLHGPAAAADAARASQVLFGGDLDGISETNFNDIVGEVPSREVEKTGFDAGGLSLVELLVHSGLSASKGQARKDIEGGGIYVNNVKQADTHRAIGASELLFGKHLLLRKGKRNYTVVTVR